jgi:hypothetical protein
MNSELPLAEFADLEKVPQPPKPKYRCKVHFKIRHEGYIEYQTEGNPFEWLEDDDNIDPALDDIADWGHDSDYDGFPDYGDVEVSHDDGETWEKYNG